MGSRLPEPLHGCFTAGEPATAFPSLPSTSNWLRSAKLHRIPLLQQDVV